MKMRKFFPEVVRASDSGGSSSPGGGEASAGDASGSAAAPSPVASDTPAEPAEPASSSDAADAKAIEADFAALGDDYSDDYKEPSTADDDAEPDPEPAPSSTQDGDKSEPAEKPADAKAESEAKEEGEKAVEPPEPDAKADEPASPDTKQDDNQPASIDAVIQSIQDKREDLIAKFSDDFQLSSEMVDEIEADVTTAIPKLFAHARTKALEDTLSIVKDLVPGLVQSQIAFVRNSEESEKAFFEQFKDLNVKEHGQDILQIATALRNANPSMDKETLMTLTGQTVMVKHGVQPSAQAAADPAPAKPAEAPFKPAGVGTTPASSNQGVAPGPFDGLGEIFDD